MWRKFREQNHLVESRISEIYYYNQRTRSYIWLEIKKRTNTDSTQHITLSSVQPRENVLICGGSNTGFLPDYNCDEGNNHIFGSTYPQNLVKFAHNASDKQQKVNNSSELLTELCTSLGLYLLNGRVRGDSLGRCLQLSSLGCSTIDYMIQIWTHSLSKHL